MLREHLLKTQACRSDADPHSFLVDKPLNCRPDFLPIPRPACFSAQCHSFRRIQTIPFVLELRSLLDWVCTDSTLTLFHWLKMEDIYANIYILKCYRTAEKVEKIFLIANISPVLYNNVLRRHYLNRNDANFKLKLF